MNTETIRAIGDQLYQAILDRATIRPLTDQYDDFTIQDAYNISLRILERRLEAGEKIIGKKIGVTSDAVMDMLDVRQPDFGFMTDAMRFDGDMPISTKLIQPRAEGELAFILKKNLLGPGVTNADVVAATEAVVPCFEVVDSRIQDWRIKIQDTVADNASCGLFTINESAAVSPTQIDLATCRMEVVKNGKIWSTGVGAAAMGNPLHCVTWLANTLGELGISLNAGDIILSGSLVPLEPVVAGDQMTVTVSGIGACSVNFC